MTNDKPTGRDKRKETAVSPAAIRAFSAMFRQYAALFDQLAALVETVDIGHVHAKNLNTGTDGMVSLGKFAGAIIEAYLAHHSVTAVKEIGGGLKEMEKLLSYFPAQIVAEAQRLAAKPENTAHAAKIIRHAKGQKTPSE